MRCVRCGYDGNESSATICKRCGKALIDPSKQIRSEAATPVWARPKAPEPVEAPPWAQADNAAAWQTPPEFGKPKVDKEYVVDDLVRQINAAGTPAQTAKPRQRPTRPGPAPVPAGRAERTAGPARSELSGRSGHSGSESAATIPHRPPEPEHARPAAITFVIAALAGVGALAMAVYGFYALFVRRAIFAELASSPSAVDQAGAQSSDTVNGVLFALAGVLTLAAVVALGLWFRGEGLHAVPKAWIGVAAGGVLAVVIALVLHRVNEPGPVATGYLVLGLGGLLVGGALGWAAALVVRADPAVAGEHDFPAAAHVS